MISIRHKPRVDFDAVNSAALRQVRRRRGGQDDGPVQDPATARIAHECGPGSAIQIAHVV